MTFAFVLIGFVFGVVVGNFFVGLLFGAAGWVLARWIRKDHAATEAATAEAMKGSASGPTPTAPSPEPELEDFVALRDYVRSLSRRVAHLEARLEPASQAPVAVPPSTAAQAAPDAAPAVAPEVPAEPVPMPAPQPELVRAAEPRFAPASPEPALAAASAPATSAPAAPAAAQEEPPQDQVEPAREEYLGEPAPRPAAAGSALPALLNRLVTENIVAKVGVIVLFIGVGFLLKFAYDRGMMPPQLRLAGVAALAAALFFIGWRLRGTRRLYGTILQGAASGLAYLDVFFALKTYGFIGPVAGFGLFALLGVATTLAAVRQDAVVLAVLGLIGAFSAPILASTGSGNHVLLFSYYTLLNVFILAVSWFKAWRPLNLTGWFFTFAVGLLWGANNYRPELFGTVEPFVLLFFALYLVIPILFATRQPPELKGLVDATLVFGTPAAVAVMQAGLVRDMPYGLAWSAALGGALYGLLAGLVWRHENMRLLRETYLALAVGLGTLAIFFGFDAYPTFALWTLEGTAILWVGLRQRHALARWFGLLVQLGGATLFVLEYPEFLRPNPVLNDAVFGCLWITLAGFISAVLVRRYADRVPAAERGIATLLLLWGAAWWSAGGLDALYHAVARNLLPASAGIYFALGALAVEFAGARAAWPQLRLLASAHSVVLVLAAAAQLGQGGHALGNFGWVAWPLGLGIAFWTVRRQERDDVALLAELRYAVQWGVLAMLATWEELWLMREREYAYGMLLAAAGHAAAWLRFHLRERDDASAMRGSAVVMLWAVAFWFAQGLFWAYHRLEDAQLIAVGLALAAATALAYEWGGRLLAWPGLRHASLVLWLAMVAGALAQIAEGLRPWRAWGWAAWPAVFAAGYWVLLRQVRDRIALLPGLRQAILWGTLAVLATYEQVWMLRVDEHAYGMLVAGAGYAIAYLCLRFAERDSAAAWRTSTAVLLWAIGFWFAHGGAWANERLEYAAFISAGLGLAVASAFAYEVGGRLLGWHALRQASLLLWAAIAAAVALQFEAQLRPSASVGWLAWPAAYAVAYWSLHRQEADGVAGAAPVRHSAGAWLLACLLVRELSALLGEWRFGSAWVGAAWGLALAAVIAAAVRLGNDGRWPVAPRLELYRGPVLAPLAVLGGLWVAYANIRAPGTMSPIAYLPLLNPIDVAVGSTLGALLMWSRWFPGDRASVGVLVRRALLALGFVWLNAIALRSIHYWDGVPYRIDQLLASVLVQATLSLLWTATAMALMFLSRRNGQRPMWILGAALLAVVVGKLFLVDLANSGTVARIVSFIGVGALLLVIGYVAPVPPGERAERSADAT